MLRSTGLCDAVASKADGHRGGADTAGNELRNRGALERKCLLLNHFFDLSFSFASNTETTGGRKNHMAGDGNLQYKEGIAMPRSFETSNLLN